MDSIIINYYKFSIGESSSIGDDRCFISCFITLIIENPMHDF